MHTDSLGTAQWYDPEVFGERHSFEDGKFWIGRSPTDGAPLGHKDDRHVCLVSGSRAGKGTSVIIPNLCLWRGSLLAVDPKGENATVAAARRGTGSDYCEGMGQPVHVLDPFRVAQVEEGFRSQFNPLDELDFESATFLDDVGRIADAIVVPSPGAKEPFWDQSARNLVKWLIVHVVTYPLYEGNRNLVTVRGLIARGEWETYKIAQEENLDPLPSAYQMLWQTMIDNEAHGGNVSALAEQMIGLEKNDPKLLSNLLQTVHRHTEFLDSPGMAECVSASSFQLSDLKTSETGISVFLCLPQRYMAEHFRWLRMVVTLGIGAAEATPGQPQCGHRTLFCLDEFAGLKKMEIIEHAVAQIAGFGVTLFFILQSLEQLKATYKDNWQTFMSNCSLKMFFGVDDHFTRDHLSKMLGEAEIVRDLESSQTSDGTSSTKTRSTNESNTVGESEGISRTTTESRSESLNETETHGRQSSSTIGDNTSLTDGDSYSKNKSKNWNKSRSKSSNWQRSKGTSSNHTDGWQKDGLLGDSAGFFPFLRQNETANYSTGGNRSSGVGGGSSRSFSFGGGIGETWGKSQSRTHGSSRSQTEGDSFTRSKGRTIGETHGTSEGETKTRSSNTTHGRGESSADGTTHSVTRGKSQSLHKRPLITPDEIGKFFDRPVDGIPAWGLVVVGGGAPAVVHRSPYYSDQHLQWLFDPHPDHDAPPKLVGELFAWVLEPPPAITSRIDWLAQSGDTVEPGDTIARVEMLPPTTFASKSYISGRNKRIARELAEIFSTEEEAFDERFGLYRENNGPTIEIQSPRGGRFVRSEPTSIEGEDWLKLTFIGNRRKQLLLPSISMDRTAVEYADWAAELPRREAESERRAEQWRQKQAQREADKAREQKEREEEEIRQQREAERQAAERRLREEASELAKSEYLRGQVEPNLKIRDNPKTLLLPGAVFGLFVAGLFGEMIGKEMADSVGWVLVLVWAIFGWIGSVFCISIYQGKRCDKLKPTSERWASMNAARKEDLIAKASIYIQEAPARKAKEEQQERERAEQRERDKKERLRQQEEERRATVERSIKEREIHAKHLEMAEERAKSAFMTPPAYLSRKHGLVFPVAVFICTAYTLTTLIASISVPTVVLVSMHLGALICSVFIGFIIDESYRPSRLDAWMKRQEGLWPQYRHHIVKMELERIRGQ